MAKKMNKGFTLLELIISISIFAMIAVVAGALFGYALKTQRLVWDQLEAQSEGRKAISIMVGLLRKTEQSSTGAYNIDTATTSSLIFYANVDVDAYKEKVRFWLSGKTLKRGITKPNGNPLVYNSANEQVLEIAHNLFVASSTPLFLYYDENYAGSGNALSQPVDVTKIRVVRVQLEIEKDPNKSPIPFFVESVVSLRNLKAN
jgi:prepilin-type N-terminal cleavage/methylation domain-containing protein